MAIMATNDSDRHSFAGFVGVKERDGRSKFDGGRHGRSISHPWSLGKPHGCGLLLSVPKVHFSLPAPAVNGRGVSRRVGIWESVAGKEPPD